MRVHIDFPRDASEDKSEDAQRMIFTDTAARVFRERLGMLP